jgi:hypothetical protein
MGSSTSGKFRDYPPSQEKKGGSGGSGGSQGGGGGGDRCNVELSNVRLEEVGGSPYFQAHNDVPAAGIVVALRATTVGPRLSIDTLDGQRVGLLPTEYNYLVVCMKKGFAYSGEVSNSSLRPVPAVRINLRATGK